MTIQVQLLQNTVHRALCTTKIIYQNFSYNISFRVSGTQENRKLS